MKNPDNPYVGPVALTAQQRIYGRDREIADLMNQLISERIVLVYSPSGAGKTSMLQAGLMPEMTKRGFTVRNLIRVGGEPPDGLRENRYGISTMASLQLEGKPASAGFGGFTLSQYLDANPNGELLVFDQFEEVLTADPFNTKARERFFDEIGDALRARGRWAVFAMREDYLARLDPYLRRVPTRLSNTFRLNLLSFEQSIDAIRNPATKARVPVDFTADAAKKLAENLSAVNVHVDGRPELLPGQFVEPVQLQVVCFDLWERLPEGTQSILPEDIEKVGNIDEALGAYYDRSVKNTATEQSHAERSIRDWFEDRLINRQGIRAQVLKGDGLDSEVADRLEKAHLVRSDSRLGSTWVELAHDRLIKPVRDNNEAWRKQNLSPFQQEAEKWDDNKRSPDRLLRGEALQQAKDWLASAKELNSTEEDYLKASQEAELVRQEMERSQRKELETARKIKALAAAIVLLGLVFALSVGGLLWWKKESLKKSAIEYARSALKDHDRQIEAQALWIKGKPTQALTYLAAALRKQPDSQARKFAASSLAAGNLKIPLREVDHEGPVERIVFSGDGTRLMTMSAHSSRVWDPSTGQSVGKRLSGSPAGVLSRDGTRAALFNSSSILVLEVTSGKELLRMSGPRGSFDQVEFAGDGQHLVTGSKEIRRWDLATKEFIPMNWGREILLSVFNAASSWVLALQKNAGGAWKSDTRGDRPSINFEDTFTTTGCWGPPPWGPPPLRAALNSTGTRAAFAAGKNVYVWDTGKSSAKKLQEMTEPCSVGFTQDGQKVVVTGKGWLGVWNTETSKLDSPQWPAEDPKSQVVFQTGWPVFVEAGTETLLLRDVKTGDHVARALIPNRSVFIWALSAGGKTLATAAKEDKTVEIWDVAPGPAPAAVPDGVLGSGSVEDGKALADLAELVAGIRKTEESSDPVRIPLKERRDLYQNLTKRPGLGESVQAAIQRFH